MSDMLIDEDFRLKVDEALKKTREILHDERHVKLPSDVQHKYGDKFLLAEFLTKVSIASQIRVLRDLGFDYKTVSQCKEWSKIGSITMRFTAEEKCTFIESRKVKVENPVSHEVSVLNAFRSSISVATVTLKYFWEFICNMKIMVFPTNEESKGIILSTKHVKCEVVTLSDEFPYPKVLIRPNIDINMNWFFKHIKVTDQSEIKGETTLPNIIEPQFLIDRSLKTCRTPVRNEDTQQSMIFNTTLEQFYQSVKQYLNDTICSRDTDTSSLDMNAFKKSNVFIPIFPIYDDSKLTEEQKEALEITDPNQDSIVAADIKEKSFILAPNKTQKLLNLQDRDLKSAVSSLKKSFPTDGRLITSSVVCLSFLCLYGSQLTDHYTKSITFIEEMIRQQLISAIGKIVTPADFLEYMIYHNRKLLKEKYRPKPFAYAIRRPEHAPEGIISIERSVPNGGVNQPVQTMVYENPHEQPMHFNISASTRVQFKGKQSLHCWMNQQFNNVLGTSYTLTARAKQFSSFILVLGRIASPHEFDPQYAIVIQNKDEIIIPLLLEHLPSAQEFADAIESLSPEQQRFAQAYRSMQLESTMFGIAVIQIKPQLEKLLKLDDDSLTKERKLTEDLMTLFIKYQISSDLMSYSGPKEEKSQRKVEEVRKQVNIILSEIEEQMKKELEEKEREREYERRDQEKENLWIEAQRFKKKKKHKNKKVSEERCETRSMDIMDIMDIEPNEPEPEKPCEQEQDEKKNVEEKADNEVSAITDILDYTSIPGRMDAMFQVLDKDNALKAAIIRLKPRWSKKHFPGLLGNEENSLLNAPEQKTERNKAFDLLDALSRSGELPIDQSELHVVIPITHCFYDNLINTVVKDNVNPIEKVERSICMIGSFLHNMPVESITKQSAHARIHQYSKNLFLENSPLPQLK